MKKIFPFLIVILFISNFSFSQKRKRNNTKRNEFSNWSYFFGPTYTNFDIGNFYQLKKWDGYARPISNFGIERQLSNDLSMQYMVGFSKSKKESNSIEELTLFDTNLLFATGKRKLLFTKKDTYSHFILGLGFITYYKRNYENQELNERENQLVLKLGETLRIKLNKSVSIGFQGTINFYLGGINYNFLQAQSYVIIKI